MSDSPIRRLRSLAYTSCRVAPLCIVILAVLGNATDALAQALSYPQRQTVKLAEDNLYQVEANLESVTKEVEAATAKDASQAQANINALSKYLKYANDQLAKLPADHADVQGLVQRAADAAVSIAKLQTSLDGRVKQTEGAMNAEAAQLEADIDKLGEWGKAFSDAPNHFHRKPDDALLLVSNIAHVEAEWKAIQGRWPALLDEKNHEPDARKIQAAANYFDRSFPSFKSHIAKLQQELPGQTDEQFKQVQALLDRAAAEKNPLLITNGVSREMAEIEGKVKLMIGIDKATGAPYQHRLEAQRVTVKQAEQALRDAIIEANQPPQAQYAGEDVASLREQVKAKWKVTHPNDEILAIVFNTPGWERVTRWQWRLHTGAAGDITGGTWEKVDYDHIQPKVIVRHDQRLAVVYPVDMYKDHMKGEQLAIKPWEKAADPDVRDLVLVERVGK